MPNTIAYLALLLWPGVAFLLHRLLPPERAVIWSILGAYLVLPPVANIDLPLFPRLDKVSIPSAAAFLIPLMLGYRIPPLPRGPLARLLALMFLLTPVASVLTNGDPIRFARGGLPGLRAHDTIGTIIAQMLALAPFLLGRRFLATAAGARELLVALVVAGLLYSLPMLFEVRMSPQLNIWIYGFFQHDFAQMMRGGGFRPIVFLYHGLWVAFLTFMTLTAAVALWRSPPRPGTGGRYLAASGLFAVLLVLCKSAAALVYAGAALPLARFAGARTRFLCAALLGLIAVSYPLLRGAELVPVDAIVARAEAVNAERAQSVAFRFANEESLLAHARERPWFGWGPWGRNQLYDVYSGEMTSVSDGRWIIVIGMFGWSGYLAEFGLLALPLVMLARRALGQGGAAIPEHAGPLALILGFNMIDMLPNATLIPFTWLIAGALLGLAEARETAPDARGAEAEPPAAARPRTIL
ncbi:hypothetical protein [Amaricoccus solimangrovi]|uniref:O-antigen ligase domain-containing protein n=1 Tax=Amaricoccus solimangrovi TaxID=2589815 RepID=A0A501WRV7_9RHOB|nr:hypothetical protein [Amaricoccus solimangrovi]TPE49741.1 hypothetical protein FJM51_13950 [Amaricoccus solimangrovi]